jgi:hypothetical protein
MLARNCPPTVLGIFLPGLSPGGAARSIFLLTGRLIIIRGVP